MEQSNLTSSLTITSTVFSHFEMIPDKYTSEGENINPPMKIKGIPKGTKSLVLFIYNPNSPIKPWDFWILWNIPPKGEILEDSIPGIQGVNSFQQHGYNGPTSNSSIHSYFFKVFALDTTLSLHQNSTRSIVKRAMQGHVLAENEIIGFYKK
jgi:Raf kinase inhibitor-like YbhB/YbcL family protein